MKQYKYELMKGSRRYICPKCQKKEFKVYVKTGTNIVVDETKYGRCNRQDACRYHQYPNIKENDIESSHYVVPQFLAPVKPKKTIVPDFIPKGTVEMTFRNFRDNVFMQFLTKTFGGVKAMELQEKYNIGTANNGGTIFWQQDKQGNFRTGKVMYYNENGRRDKNRKSWYLHNRVKPDFELQQVFFGEHLITTADKVALCESEKTAVMMSEFMPEYTWLAAGGSEMLNDFRLSRMGRLDFVCPDNGQFEKWRSKIRPYFKDAIYDRSVDDAVIDGKIENGSDILDLYIKQC